MTAKQQHAPIFDGLARDYDKAFSDRLPGQWLRAMVHERVDDVLPPEARILEIGCGTGEDAIRWAGLGHNVVATDISDAMLRETRKKLARQSAAIRGRVQTEALDAADPASASLGIRRNFDLVFSNFGVLNCVASLRPMFDYAYDHLNDGGYLAMTIMGRFCAWETFGFAVRGDFERAARRWSGHSEWTVGDITQDVWYPTVGTIRQTARPEFRSVAIYGIGALLPSTEFFGVCEQRPRLCRFLAGLERTLAGTWPINRSGDHFLIVLRRESR